MARRLALSLAAVAAILLLTSACDSGAPRVGPPEPERVETFERSVAAAAPEPGAPTADRAALRQAEQRALATQKRMVALERQFIELLEDGKKVALRRKALEVRAAYLDLADATDEYRTLLRRSLGEAAGAALFAPYKKQARGLRIAARGIGEYRKALKTGSTELAERSLRKMARGEALMKQAGDELDAAIGAGAPASRLY